MKDSSQSPIDQPPGRKSSATPSPRAPGPGQPILGRLHREIVDRCRPRRGDRILELGDCALLDSDLLQSCWIVRAGMAAPSLESRYDQLPFPPGCFACIVVHGNSLPKDCLDLAIAEAVRVLAPEGHLFLLDLDFCSSGLRRFSRLRLPAGLRRRNARKQLRGAGLHVRAQIPLTLLPARMPEPWVRRLTPMDSRLSPWLPVIASASLTIGHRREIIPPTGRAQRLRFGRAWSRSGSNSQWA